mmetsp:Transcript_23148/g.33923  ORF Transcript_23148/g.33923 Transcript_23148/m.33923 type:complete len:224 (+) Transcript_23148:40-711(+)
MSSWSDDRSPSQSRSHDSIVQNVAAVNAVLRKLAVDSDLTDDFKDPVVKIAIQHWTNEKRLPPEKAKKLEDNYRVMSVLQKIHMLEHTCRQLGIPVPLDHFLSRRNHLSDAVLLKYFGEDFVKKVKTKPSQNQPTGSVSSEKVIEDKPVEYGPAPRPKEEVDSDKEEPTSDFMKLVMWGKEQPHSPDFTWRKFLIRTSIEILVVSIIAALYLRFVAPSKKEKE